MGELLSANMFAYCKNNPVNLSDSTGYYADAIPFSPWAEFLKTTASILGVVGGTLNPIILFGVTLLATTALWKPVELGDGTLTAAERKSKSKEKEITEAGTPNSKSWNNAKKKIKEGSGKGINVKARNQQEAERLINEAKPKIEKRLTYEANPPKSGYEIHPVDNDYGMPHIKWRDWSKGKSNGADGHIFWDN